MTIHERDPNWGKARELTTAAEHASKVSAAKVCYLPFLLQALFITLSEERQNEDLQEKVSKEV